MRGNVKMSTKDMNKLIVLLAQMGWGVYRRWHCNSTTDIDTIYKTIEELKERLKKEPMQCKLFKVFQSEPDKDGKFGVVLLGDYINGADSTCLASMLRMKNGMKVKMYYYDTTTDVVRCFYIPQNVDEFQKDYIAEYDDFLRSCKNEYCTYNGKPIPLISKWDLPCYVIHRELWPDAKAILKLIK